MSNEKMTHTWDGHPISPTPPHGAMIVVYRDMQGQREYLLLHRAHHGPMYDGPWAWGPPSGARYPGEDIDRCAARELHEETGLALLPSPLQETNHLEWPVYALQAPASSRLRLSAEHDGYVWLPYQEALKRIRPLVVREAFELAVGEIGDW
jgi:8-oxo-dGTP pyrophosphatase MutT (NUDIX family)